MFARVVSAVMLLALSVVTISTVEAQERVAPGYLDVGFGIGDANEGNAAIAAGIRAEKLLKALPGLGGGVLGVQVGVSGTYYKFGLGSEWWFFPIGVSATYHFKPGNGRFDPFIALGGGYKFANCGQYLGTWADCSTEEDEVFGIARLGAKLFASENFGLWVDGGLGSNYVNAGLLVRLK